jgi:RNA polymerase sigma-70 factor, ECF subfamily
MPFRGTILAEVVACASARAADPFDRCRGRSTSAPWGVARLAGSGLCWVQVEASRSCPRAVLDDAVFDCLVRAQRGPLERYTRRLGAPREDAEEIAATALLRAHQGAPDVRARMTSGGPGFAPSARNLWIDVHRRRQLRPVTTEDALEALASSTRSVDQIASAAEEARQICAAIALLPPTQPAAIYLREVRGLSYEEIAVELGITVTAVTSAFASRASGREAPSWGPSARACALLHPVRGVAPHDAGGQTRRCLRRRREDRSPGHAAHERRRTRAHRPAHAHPRPAPGEVRPTSVVDAASFFHYRHPTR